MLPQAKTKIAQEVAARRSSVLDTDEGDGHEGPTRPTGGYAVAAAPYDTTPKELNTVGPEQFTTTLIQARPIQVLLAL